MTRKDGFYWILAGWGDFETWQVAHCQSGVWTLLGVKECIYGDQDFDAIGPRLKQPNHYPKGK